MRSDPRVNETLAFLDASRSFDEARNAVLFFDHDGVFELRFFVEAGALAMSGTAPISAFDAARMSIREVAREFVF